MNLENRKIKTTDERIKFVIDLMNKQSSVERIKSFNEVDFLDIKIIIRMYNNTLDGEMISKEDCLKKYGIGFERVQNLCEKLDNFRVLLVSSNYLNFSFDDFTGSIAAMDVRLNPKIALKIQRGY